MPVFTLVLLFLSAPALAASNVFVVGGALSTTSQLRRCYPSYNVAGIGEAGNLQSKLISALKSGNVVLAGHSNGWKKGAVKLALGVPKNLRKKLTLVNLDGGRASAVAGQGFRKIRCVDAQNARGGRSRNFGASSGCQERSTIKNANAAAGWALHFAVMNSNVPAGLCGPPNLGGKRPPACWWGTHGFDGCRGVTSWAKP